MVNWRPDPPQKDPQEAVILSHNHPQDNLEAPVRHQSSKDGGHMTQDVSRKESVGTPGAQRTTYWLTGQRLETDGQTHQTSSPMPHAWILESLELYKMNRTLRAFVQSSMGLWKTNLEDNVRPPAEVTLKGGIYQGDLCPHCCPDGLNPLSQA